MNGKNITIISFGNFESTFLKTIAERIGSVLDSQVRIFTAYLDLIEFYDPNRNQYNANSLLNLIENNYAVENVKTIGLFNVDLFIPIFTYIFGQAFLSGRSGIASAYRLRNERYGIKPDTDILLQRFTKEIIHELGHTLGLIHCHIPDCVMRSGTYVEDIDQKKANFCPKCLNELANLLTVK